MVFSGSNGIRGMNTKELQLRKDWMARHKNLGAYRERFGRKQRHPMHLWYEEMKVDAEMVLNERDVLNHLVAQSSKPKLQTVSKVDILQSKIIYLQKQLDEHILAKPKQVKRDRL